MASARGAKTSVWLQRLFAIAVVIAIVVLLIRQWPQVAPQLALLSWPAVLGSLAAVGVGLIAGLLSWRRLLAEIGSPLPCGAAARIYYVAQLGKYLPGSVWPVLAMMELGHQRGVPRSRIVVSSVLALGLSVLTGLLIGIPALVVQGSTWLPAAIALAALAALLLYPPLLNSGIATALRLLRRPKLPSPLRARAIATAAGLYLLYWVIGGLHLWLLVLDLGGPVAASLPTSIAAFAVASTLGVLVVLAPAGAGVRDVLIVLMLASVLPTAAATAVAVVSRLMLTVVDILAAGYGLLGVRRNVAGQLPAPR